MNAPAPSKTNRVLVVEDAPEFVELLVPLLRTEGYSVRTSADGESAVEMVRSFQPDVILLDLTLPRLDGVEVCRRVRDFTDAYIVMLTARTDEVDRVVGLEVGADDYVTKPFSARELVARIRAMLRRPRGGATQPRAVRRIGALEVDPVGREVRLDGETIELTKTEFDILELLSSRPEMVFSREVIRARVWGLDWFGDDHAVDVHIANLRKKIDESGGASRVRTIRGVGYRMDRREQDGQP